MSLLIFIILLSTTSCAHSSNTSDIEKNVKRSTATSNPKAVKFVVIDETPNFTMTYFYESADVSINISGGFKSKELPGSGKALFVSFVNNESSEELVADWYPTGLTHSNQNGDSNAFTVKINRKDSLTALKSLDQLSLVFSEDQKKIIGTLNLGSYCETNPDNFKDMTTKNTGCTPDEEKLNSIPVDAGLACTTDQISKEDNDFSCGLPGVLKEGLEEKLGCKLRCN